MMRSLKASSGDGSVLLVVAHPDDETIGAGGILPRLGDVWLTCVTDGSPSDLSDAQHAGCATGPQYAAMRQRELQAAAALAGISADRIQMLGVPDQQASYHVLDIAQAIATQIAHRRPALLITHAYEGGHPDHDAVALAVHAARVLVRNRGTTFPGTSFLPDVIEMACYHGAWDRLATNEFLRRDDCPPLIVSLSRKEQERKRRMIQCHASQRRVLDQFGTEREAVRLAPPYDFSQPPHAGTLWYERFDWGMTGPRWRQLAAAALRNLMPDTGTIPCR